MNGLKLGVRRDEGFASGGMIARQPQRSPAQLERLAVEDFRFFLRQQIVGRRVAALDSALRRLAVVESMLRLAPSSSRARATNFGIGFASSSSAASGSPWFSRCIAR